MQEEHIVYDDLPLSEAEVGMTIEELAPSIDVVEGQTFNIELSDTEIDMTVEELSPVISIEEAQTFNIELSEAFPAVGEIDELNHALLYNREIHDAHPITAITGLREELDSIEALQTIYSDKKGNADYYEWADGNHGKENRVGFFVSLDRDVRKISICTGDDIFGVVVDSAAFVGGQDDVARNIHYGLVATTGVAHVRCELNVIEGDYVVSNSYGVAKRAGSNCGYKVVTVHNIEGVPHATINLNISADQVDEIGAKLQDLDSRMDAAETNIISAVNVANEAHNKVINIDASNRVISDKVDSALGTVDKLEGEMADMSTLVSNSMLASTQAKAIAESAAVSAESIKNEAVKSANDAVSSVNKLIDEMKPITEWTDPDNPNNKGAYYFQEYLIDGLSTKVDIETFETVTEEGFSAIQRNAKELSSIIATIDKYTVGEYSLAHGLTWEQAQNIVETGMIYAPTESHTETYAGEPAYTRSFTPGYLYMWGQVGGTGPYKWITIDKNYNPTDDTNTSAQAVYFSNTEIAISGNFGYWYTDGDTITDLDGNTNTYEPYTLYKWMGDHWLAVATLKGNVNNRITSQIKQTADEVAVEVTNARGSAATLGARITDTESEVQSIAAWTKDENGEQYNLATIKQTADEAGADIALVVQEKDGEKVVNGASIVAAINNQGESSVLIEGDRINLKGMVTFEDFDDETKEQIEADTIDVQIWSSRGNIFKSRDVSSILTCHVFKAGVEITDTLPNSAFRWIKTNNDGTIDEMWTATPYGNNVNAIQITSADVFSRAIFSCAVEI